MRRGATRRSVAVAVALVAVCLGSASTGASGQTSTSAPTTGVCSQWDVTGTWAVAIRGTIASVAFAVHTATGERIDLSGTATLPNGQWQGAGWEGPTNPMTGTLIADKIEFTITAPHTDGFISVGQYKGTVTEGRIVGKAQDLNALERGSYDFTATGTTKCLSFETANPEGQLLRALGLEELGKHLSKTCENDPCPIQGSDDAAKNFETRFCSPVPPGCQSSSLTPEQQRMTEVVRLSVRLADASDGFPGVRATLKIITRLAYLGVTEKDPEARQQAATAAARLLTLVASLDATQSS